MLLQIYYKLFYYSLDPLRKYNGETVRLELPGDLIIFNVDWFSIFDVENKDNLGSIIIPDGLNVPPSLVKEIVSWKLLLKK